MEDAEKVAGHNKAGEEYLLAGKHAEAAMEFQAALKISPSDAVIHNGIGRVLYAEKKYQEAAAAFQKAAELAPSEPTYYNNWGLALSQLGNYEEASKKHQKAIDLDSTYVYAYRCLGDDLYKLKRDSLADDVFEKLVKVKPEYAYLEWGRVLVGVDQHEKAVEKFQKAEPLTPKDAGLYYSWGQALSELGRYEEAVKKYQKTLRLDFMHLNAHTSLGDALYKLKKDGEAEKVFRKLVKIKAEFAYAEWGRILAAHEHYEKAIEKYRQATELSPRNVDAYNRWGLALSALGKFDEAIRKFQKTIELDSTYQYAYRNLGEALYKTKKERDAADLFQKLGQFAPEYAYIEWGNVLVEMDQPDLAVEKFRKASEYSPGDPGVYNSLGRAQYQLGRYEEAIKQYRKAIDCDGAYMYSYRNWADALYRLKKESEAEEVFQRLAQIKPEYAYTEWGRLLADAGQHEKAIEKYQKASECAPKAAGVYNSWGLSLVELGRSDDAIRMYQKSIELDRTYTYAYSNWGSILYKLKRESEAADVFQKLVGVKPEYAYAEWGRVLDEDGQYEKAIEKFQKAAEIKPDDTNALNRWGNSLFSLKRYSAAKDLYQKTLAIDPSLVFVYNNLGLALYHLDQLEGAIDVFTRAIECDHSYSLSHHNRAHVLWKQGKYKAAMDKWEETCSVREATKWRARRDRNTEHFQLHAAVLQEIFQDYVRAEKTFKEGLEINSKDLGILIELVRLYRAMEADADSRRGGGEHEAATQQMITAHWKALETFKLAEQLVQEEIRTKESAAAFSQAGDLYLIMEDYDTSGDHLRKAIERDKDDAEAHVMLGTVYSRKGEFTKAIEHLKSARKWDAQNLGIRSYLAEACMKAGQIENAEAEYLEILRVTPYHIESEIGLGEVYKEMGEKEEEFYEQSITHFTYALTKSQSENKSKRLNRKELSALYYSRGYARVAVYESQKLLKDEQLLREARRDFKSCLESDPMHRKAKRGIEKLNKKSGGFAPKGITERSGPWIISVASFLVFLASQVSFFIGKPMLAGASYMITDESIAQLRMEVAHSETPIQLLETLKGRAFAVRDEFLDSLKARIGASDLDKLKGAIIRNALRSDRLQWSQPIDQGYYVVLTFGSLIFMVAGFFLPHLLKLKVGAIELEKGPVAEIAPSGGLGISK